MKAIFLDRDGTINQLKKWQKYVSDVKDVKLWKNVKETLKKLKDLWYKLIVITNQTWVWAWYYTQKQVEEVNREIEKQLWFNFNKIYACYHHPNANCECRKPKTKNIEQAIQDFNIDIKQSYFIWDKEKDIQTWKKVWCKWTILISNEDIKIFDIKPDFIIEDFSELLDIVK